MRYNIISTGSKGNAVIIEDIILIDCGVSFKALKPYYKNIKLVLLTHIHGDHFKKATIKRLAAERPSLRFGCGRWLAQALVDCGVPKRNIDILDADKMYGYGVCNVIPVSLTHNVPNQGYKIHFGAAGKLIYATDTNNLNGITARDYDLYMIEADYEDTEIQERIRAKESAGEYAYEYDVLKNHLSKQKADDFIYANIGAKGEYIYMHCHEGVLHGDRTSDDTGAKGKDPALKTG